MKYELISAKDDTITVNELPTWFNAILGIAPIVRVFKHQNEVYKQSNKRVWYEFETGKQMDGNAELDALYRKATW